MLSLYIVKYLYKIYIFVMFYQFDNGIFEMVQK